MAWHDVSKTLYDVSRTWYDAKHVNVLCVFGNMHFSVKHKDT